MTKAEQNYNRVYKIVKSLREDCNMSYEQIMVFWKNCIKEAKKRENE